MNFGFEHFLQVKETLKDRLHTPEKDKRVRKHIHDWQKFKQTIRADNPEYKHHAHDIYFVVLACSDCKQKTYVDFRMD